MENQYETHLYRKDGERISVLVDLQERLEGILAVVEVNKGRAVSCFSCSPFAPDHLEGGAQEAV